MSLLFAGRLGNFPDSKVHGANIGPTWVLSAPAGPHTGPRNPAIRVVSRYKYTRHGCTPSFHYKKTQLARKPSGTLFTNIVYQNVQDRLTFSNYLHALLIPVNLPVHAKIYRYYNLTDRVSHLHVMTKITQNIMRPRKNGRHFPDDKFRFFSKKIYEFRLRFHWSLFLRVQLTIFQHLFR